MPPELLYRHRMRCIHLIMIVTVHVMSAIPSSSQATTHISILTNKTIDTLLAEADNLRRQQKVEEAIQIYRQVFSRYLQEYNQQRAGETAVTVGSLYSEHGQYEEAIHHLELAVDIFRQIENPTDEAVTLVYLGNTHTAWSRYPEALEILQQAVATARSAEDQAGEWSALKSLGDTQLHTGHFDAALQSYSEALRISEYDNKACRNNLTLYGSLGSVHTALGQYRHAIAQSELALATLNDACDDVDQHERENLLADIGLVQGILYLQIGDDARALPLLEEALTISRQAGSTRREAAILTTLGSLYETTDEYMKAIGMYEQTLTIADPTISDVERAITMNNSAKAWIRLCADTGNSQFGQALPFYDSALDIVRKAGAEMVEARILNNIGEMHLYLSDEGRKAGELEQASRYFREALTIQQTLQNRTYAWLPLSNLGQTYAYQDQLQEAVHQYQQAINLLEDLTTVSRIEELTIPLREQAAETYERLMLLLIRQGRHEEAFQVSERARARAFLDQLGNRKLPVHHAANTRVAAQEYAMRQDLIAVEKALQHEYQKPEDVRNQAHLQFLHQQQNRKRSQYERVRIAMKSSDPVYESFVAVEPLALQEIQALLDSSTTLVSYVVTAESVLAFVITKETFDTALLPLPEHILTTAVHSIRQPAAQNDLPPDELVFLYEQLIQPIAPHLNTSQLIIVPHGVLHYLPFAALTDGQRFLIDRYRLVILPAPQR